LPYLILRKLLLLLGYLLTNFTSSFSDIDLLSPHPPLLHDPVELTVKVLESLAEVNGQLWLLFQQVKRLQLRDVLLGCLSTLDVNNAVESLSEAAVYGFLQVNLQHGSEELAFVLVL
jgi:hypothetical protein